MSDRRRLDELTPRQQQVVRLIREGLSDKEIAVKLGIEEQTVKNLLRSAYRATNTHNRVALLGWAYEIRERVA
jgi:two-component system nitrate/nitrite response regulator NarL